MLEIKYHEKYNIFFIGVFYLLLIIIIVLSVAPHENVAQQMSEKSDSSFWELANKYNSVGKLAYVGEDLFGLISDKIRHIFAFLVLSVCIDFAHTLMANKIKIYLLVGYGVFIEVLQYFLPYREFDFGDIVFNALAVFIYFLLFRRFFAVGLKTT